MFWDWYAFCLWVSISFFHHNTTLSPFWTSINMGQGWFCCSAPIEGLLWPTEYPVLKNPGITVQSSSLCTFVIGFYDEPPPTTTAKGSPSRPQLDWDSPISIAIIITRHSTAHRLWDWGTRLDMNPLPPCVWCKTFLLGNFMAKKWGSKRDSPNWIYRELPFPEWLCNSINCP